MESHFDAEFFRDNRARLRKLFTGKAPIVITANGLQQRSGDTTFPFRQDSNFWYLTGINQPDFVLVMDKDEDYLIAPFRSIAQTVMEGKLDTKPLSQRSGISNLLDNKAGWKKLEARLKKVKHAATLIAQPPYIEHHGFYTNPARQALVQRLKETNPNLKLLDLRLHLARMRTVKQPAELAAIKQAIKVSSKAFRKVKASLARYEYEHEIEAELNKQFRLDGSSGHAFSPIVASGKNAATIHYLANSESLKNKKLLLVDAGAEVENYAADISRTYALKPLNKREQAVYSAVQEVQDYAKSLLKPGISLSDYEKLIEHYMGEKLRELGLIKTISREHVRKYYPHSTSHFLGLDVHDSGDYEHQLQAGAVLTVEPGIYIPKEGIGVRIEDDMLITKNGSQNLSKAVPYI